MGFIDWMRNIFGVKQKPLDDGTVEQAFNVTPAVSDTMKNNIVLWWQLYTVDPPWLEKPGSKCTGVHTTLDIAGGIVRELARFTLSEFSVTASGSQRADYINERLQTAAAKFYADLELGLALGGVALRPYMERGNLYIDVCGPTSFTPTAFDGDGNAIGGVFVEKIEYKKQLYSRMEYHGFEYAEDGTPVYTIRNKAYKGEPGSQEINLKEVPEWANIWEVQTVDRKGGGPLEKPLFAYFKNPTSNNIDPTSKVGVSVFGRRSTIDRLREADEQWELIKWEYKSGERKVFTDGVHTRASQFADRLFESGDFTPDGKLFQIFDPAFRNDALYQGLQYILRYIEDDVGLARSTFSDSEYAANPKTATEIAATKEGQRKTVKAIQAAWQSMVDCLAYAIDVFCDLHTLAPAGDYELAYTWGDGVLDDPDMIRQDKAMDMQEVNAGLKAPFRYVMKWEKLDEDTAKQRIAEVGLDELMTDQEDSGEIE